MVLQEKLDLLADPNRFDGPCRTDHDQVFRLHQRVFDRIIQILGS